MTRLLSGQKRTKRIRRTRAIATVGPLTEPNKQERRQTLDSPVDLVFATARHLTEGAGDEDHIEIDSHQHQQSSVVVRAGRWAIHGETVAREQFSSAAVSFTVPFNERDGVAVAHITVVNVDLHVKLAFTNVTQMITFTIRTVQLTTTTRAALAIATARTANVAHAGSANSETILLVIRIART